MLCTVAGTSLSPSAPALLFTAGRTLTSGPYLILSTLRRRLRLRGYPGRAAPRGPECAAGAGNGPAGVREFGADLNGVG